ncbi:hypothetical protein DNU06_10870 [Putridiphycobacter roseus]|uniref:Outer membrane protein beta-barrel domain-containing protein n=1 Tax=Putridiphycobacter roseus TaxID=2219161 RepID=A0A2W1MZD8_9FLAO|nr:outer membrane beta-barrel protein [Putridiphycobacter roseus]PZE16754.1 hypothetical protein DNU06_10870 [Putridiphycobacter roseus]
MLKILSVTLLLCTVQIGLSQIDNSNKLQFGFSMGANYSHLKVVSPNNDYQSINNLGSSLGILSQLNMGSRLSLVGMASLSFNNGYITEANLTQYQVTEYLSKTLDFGLNLRFKLKPDANFSPYLTVGPTYQINLDKNDLSNVFLPSNNLSLDLGFGLDKKLAFFNIAPELKYSLGLINVNQNPTITSARAHYLKLIINFTN